MSEDKGQTEVKSEKAINQKVGSLLPPAKIHLFSDDLDTLNLFHGLGEDWRFGRINMGIRGDNLDEAIEHYSRRKSPTLILIQTETTGEAFEKKLGNLAEFCDEGTAAIVIGPVNDVQLYRHLTSIGVSDYLVAPLAPEDLVEAIANSLQNVVGAVDSHLMALAGVKGGVGTTSITAMVGDILSKDFEAKTLVMDAAGGQSSLWSHFGFSPSGTLIESARAVVDNDKDALDRLIVKKSDHLHVLNSGTENILDNPVATQAYEVMLDYFLSVYPNVIVDTSNAPIQIKRMVLSRANSIGIVTTPRVPDLSLTKMLMKAIKDMPGSENRKTKIIINKANASKSDIPSNDIQDALDQNNILALPFNTQLFANAENSGEPLYAQKEFDAFKSNLTPLISEMAGLKMFALMQTQMNKSLLSILRRVVGR